MGTVRVGGAKDRLFDLFSGEWWTDPMTAAATGVFDSSAWRWDEELLSVSGITDFQLPQVRDATDHAPLGARTGGGDRASPRPTSGRRGNGRAASPARRGRLGRDGGDLHRGDKHCVPGGERKTHAGPDNADLELPGLPDVLGHWRCGQQRWERHILATAADRERCPGRPAARGAVCYRPILNFFSCRTFLVSAARFGGDDLRAAIVGLAAHHGQLDIVRAALDGISAAAQELAEAVSAHIPRRPTAVRLTGGFLQENAWAQLVTDALGMPTAVPDPKEATATGAAVLGWLSLGVGAPADLLSSRRTEERYPDMAAHQVLSTKGDLLRATRRLLFPDEDAVSTGDRDSSMKRPQPA